MRLICPNCGAQYEVADDVIPAAGRDVQCSNCGHTWLERPGASEAAEAGEAQVAARAPDKRPEAAPEAAPEPERHAAPRAAPAPVETAPPDPAPQDPAPEPDPEVGPEQHPEPMPQVAAAPQRRTISPEIAEILREEAAREAAARQREAETGLESQPELGLDGSPDPAPGPTLDPEEQRAEESRRRMARMRGEPAPPIAAAVAGTARRDLLPDIEEINSSLRSTADRSGTMAPEPDATGRNQRRSFRWGFSSVLLIAAAAAFAYVLAPRIIAAVPQTEPALTRYVAMVDDGRLWLDLQMQAVIARLGDASDDAAPQEQADGN